MTEFLSGFLVALLILMPIFIWNRKQWRYLNKLIRDNGEDYSKLFWNMKDTTEAVEKLNDQYKDVITRLILDSPSKALTHKDKIIRRIAEEIMKDSKDD